MEADYRASEKEVATLLKEKDTAKDQVTSAQPQTGETKSRWSTYYQAEKRHEMAMQAAKYIKLRLETRRAEARKSYLSAFDEKRSWPAPEEFADYARDKKLKNAPKDWNVRLKKQLANEAAKKDSSKSQ
jgi:hypothetical protein